MACITKGLILVVLGTALCATASRAQSTYPAADCTQAAISTAITNEQVHPVDGDIITIPAGACTWTGSTVTANFTRSVTIQGAGAMSATANGAGKTGTDNTVIVDHFTSAIPRWNLTCAAGKTCRVTGIAAYQDGTTGSENNGFFALNGVWTAQWRIDHVHIKINSGNTGIWVGGALTGVADHNYFEPGASVGVTNDYAFHNGLGWNNGPTGDSNTSWAAAPNWGSSQFFFIEDNRMYNTDVNDGSDGSRYVFRDSTVFCDLTPSSFTIYCEMFSHTTRDGQRGDAAREVYANTFSQPGPTGGGNTAVPLNSGVALVWGNTVSQFKRIVHLDDTRLIKGSDLKFTPQPSGIGKCGPTPRATGTVSVAANSTAVTWVSGDTFSTNWTAAGSSKLMIITGALCNSSGKTNIECPIASVNSSTSITLAVPSTAAVTGGTYEVGSTWDSNTNIHGYACLDGSARNGGDLLSGTTPNLTNSTTGTQVWPHQVLTPVYVWGNTFTPSGGYSPTPIADGSASYTDNVDYYQQFGTNGESGTFDGTKGVGQGLLSARPSTCTAGTDPATGGSALGVGYWATDTNTLYVCNPTNTWTAYYTPYTYPHPLTGGTSAASVNPPTGLTATVQ